MKYPAGSSEYREFMGGDQWSPEQVEALANYPHGPFKFHTVSITRAQAEEIYPRDREEPAVIE